MFMSKTASETAKKTTKYFDSQREDMLKYIPRNTKTSIEFGCGTGGFSALVKTRFKAEAWAVEINEEIARKAAEKLDKVIIGDAIESLGEIPNHFFDCVILFDILEHLYDPMSFLRILKTKLSDHGVVVASIPNIRYYRTFKQLVIHGNWDYKDQGILDRTHLRFFTRKSIVKMFNALDYHILRMEGIHPTSSRTFSILNILLFNSISDVRYKHFAIVVKPK